jgi:YD repeat-containing protein
MKVKNATNGEVVYTYTVSAFPNGYHKLTSFAPPPSLIPATTFEYYDGTNYRYELTKVTTSYGGVLEFSYVNHNFVFNGTTLDSRVASQKKITFNSGEQAKVWNFTYPSYNGVPTGTATVVGPEYTTSATHHGYDASSPWKIGLVSAKSLSDGSLSETYDWIYQELSNSNWMVLGTNMGTAKGPLVSSAISTPLGDATSKQEYLYERADPNWPKKYGLPTKIKLYVNGAGTPKSYKELSYCFEYPAYQGFLDRYMLAFVQEESRWSGSGTLLGKTITDRCQETGKWGALQRVMRLKTPPYTYLIWDYGYTIYHPAVYSIGVNPPDPPPANSEDGSAVTYSFGMADKVDEPGYTASERSVSPYNSSVLSEKNAFGHEQFYSYDDLGRVLGVNMPDPFNDVSYSWRPNGENKVVITQGSNTITKYWDGMGRDTGTTETGDSTTLYYRKTLDAEGRVKEENRASINSAHKYTYLYNAAGQVTRITDPLSEITNISYSGITRTITDAESHTTSHEYNDLPGLITKLTDAQGKLLTTPTTLLDA